MAASSKSAPKHLYLSKNCFQQRVVEPTKHKKKLITTIFDRLNTPDPTDVPELNLCKRFNSPQLVPITFRTLPDLVDQVWERIKKTAPHFKEFNTEENKLIFKKGMLILAEVKLCIAQNRSPGSDVLPSRNFYTKNELIEFNNMSSTLPYPLAMYLDCIGNTYDGKQLVTPTLAEFAEERHRESSGAITYGPRHLTPLLQRLRAGVKFQSEIQRLVDPTLSSLPAIEWEEFTARAPLRNQRIRMIRITQTSYDFWVTTDESDRETVPWSDYEFNIFTQIVRNSNSAEFNVPCDLSQGKGTMAQTVQVPQWTLCIFCQCYAMSNVRDYDLKLGIAFGFGYTCGIQVQSSKFKGSIKTAYWQVSDSPCEIVMGILWPQK